MNQIDKNILQPWLEKLRDTRLQNREIWRITDDLDLRRRNTLTDRFHYNAQGLLLRTDRGKSRGKFRDDDFTGLSDFCFNGETHTSYVDYEPGPRVPLWFSGHLSSKQLRIHFGINLDVKEGLLFWIETFRKDKTFEEHADWLERRYGDKRIPVVTHSKELLQF